MNFLDISIVFIFGFVTAFIFFSIYSRPKPQLGMLYVKEFVAYQTILQLYMDKAYDIIYKDDLLAFSLEATRVDDIHFNELTKKYNKLVLRFLGEPLTQEFINFYGSLDTLFFNMSEYFHSKYEADAITKAAQNNLINSDITNVE